MKVISIIWHLVLSTFMFLIKSTQGRYGSGSPISETAHLTLSPERRLIWNKKLLLRMIFNYQDKAFSRRADFGKLSAEVKRKCVCQRDKDITRFNDRPNVPRNVDITICILISC